MDDIIERLMKRFEYDIPPYRIDRWAKFELSGLKAQMIQSHFNDFLGNMKSKKEPGILIRDDKEKDKLKIEGIDKFGNSYDIFK